MKRTFTRREVFRMSGTVAAGTLLVACGASGSDGDPAAEEAAMAESPMDAGMAASDQESPLLAQRVQAGELPAVEERLPLNPQVVAPWGETGEYGGTGRFAGVTGNCPYEVKNLPDKRLVAASTCMWRKP